MLLPWVEHSWGHCFTLHSDCKFSTSTFLICLLPVLLRFGHTVRDVSMTGGWVKMEEEGRGEQSLGVCWIWMSKVPEPQG